MIRAASLLPLALVATVVVSGCADRYDDVPDEYFYVTDSFPPVGQEKARVWYEYRRTGKLPPTTEERIAAFRASEAERRAQQDALSSSAEAFTMGCVDTAGAPETAPAALEAVGMEPVRTFFWSRGHARFKSDFATASVARIDGKASGQCTVTLADTDADRIWSDLDARIDGLGPRFVTAQGNFAAALPGSGAYLVLNPETGAMTRVFPGAPDTSE